MSLELRTGYHCNSNKPLGRLPDPSEVDLGRGTFGIARSHVSRAADGKVQLFADAAFRLHRQLRSGYEIQSLHIGHARPSDHHRQAEISSLQRPHVPDSQNHRRQRPHRHHQMRTLVAQTIVCVWLLLLTACNTAPAAPSRPSTRHRNRQNQSDRQPRPSRPPRQSHLTPISTRSRSSTWSPTPSRSAPGSIPQSSPRPVKKCRASINRTQPRSSMRSEST